MYNAKIKIIEDKIYDISNLATNTTLNTKMNGVKKEILGITKLATTTCLTAVENKIHNISNSKKTDYSTRISETENKKNS